MGMERGFNACQMHRSMYIFNRFPVIQLESQKFAILAHFLHILASLGTRGGKNQWFFKLEICFFLVFMVF